ncbi:ABC transporter ATP-binding protein, partial [Pradoshia sp.]
KPGAISLSQAKGEVRFEQVSFGYKKESPILNGISFEAKAGSHIALVGPTGAGKTTIINLLTRFYDVGSGRITIDGTDIRDFTRESLRNTFGIVLQDTYLFTGTIKDNIKYGRLNATDDEVVEAAKMANAHYFITRLPNGYETMLSESGGNLSQGQRQLLAIARAILSDPAILILDEATSSVDTRTELAIQNAMRTVMAGRTSFMIAHRLSTIREADTIMVIDDGRIKEQGSHEELIAQNGQYRRMYDSQFKNVQTS